MVLVLGKEQPEAGMISQMRFTTQVKPEGLQMSAISNVTGKKVL